MLNKVIQQIYPSLILGKDYTINGKNEILDEKQQKIYENYFQLGLDYHSLENEEIKEWKSKKKQPTKAQIEKEKKKLVLNQAKINLTSMLKDFASQKIYQKYPLFKQVNIISNVYEDSSKKQKEMTKYIANIKEVVDQLEDKIIKVRSITSLINLIDEVQNMNKVEK